MSIFDDFVLIFDIYVLGMQQRICLPRYLVCFGVRVYHISLALLYCPHARVTESHGPSSAISSKQESGKAHRSIKFRSLHPRFPRASCIVHPFTWRHHPHSLFQNTAKHWNQDKKIDTGLALPNTRHVMIYASFRDRIPRLPQYVLLKPSISLPKYPKIPPAPPVTSPWPPPPTIFLSRSPQLLYFCSHRTMGSAIVSRPHGTSLASQVSVDRHDLLHWTIETAPGLSHFVSVPMTTPGVTSSSLTLS